MFQFSCRFVFYQLLTFKPGTENNANFDTVSSKRGNFDTVQKRRQNFNQKSSKAVKVTTLGSL